MIKSLSAYYLSVPWVSPLTSATATEYTVKIYVWSGEKLSVPITADYEITKLNLTSSIGIDKINIARLVNDFIEFTPNINTSTGIISGNNQRWVKTEVHYTTTNPSDDGVAQLENTTLLLKGYGYGNEGENSQPPTNRIYITGETYKVSRDTTFTIPIKINEITSTGGTIISRPNREIDVTFDEGVSTNSEEVVKNINIAISETTTDEYVEIIYNSKLITLIIENECRYTPIDIYFLNKEGAQQVMTFFKSKTDSLEVKRETYESNKGQAIDGYHQFTDFNIQGKSKFKVNSGFVREDTNEAFKQLILSSKVYFYDGTNFIPLNVLKNSLEFLTRQKDRLINYEFEFGYSYNEINNQ